MIGQLKKLGAGDKATDARDKYESIFDSTILEKLTNTQLNKLRSAAKNKNRAILRLNMKELEDEELPHELFLTTSQKTKLRNVFGNNTATPLARDNLPGLLNNLNSTVINKFERKISGKGAVRAGKGFTLLISNEDMKITIIIKSLVNSGDFVDEVI